MSGSAPNRIFNIEWRAVYFFDHNQTANFEARLYENDPNKRFDFVFGTVQPGSDQLYVSGVQGPNNAFTQDFCDAGAAGRRLAHLHLPGWNADTYAYSDCNSDTYGYSDGYGYSYTNAETDAYAEICANTETSSHTAAETVV